MPAALRWPRCLCGRIRAIDHPVLAALRIGEGTWRTSGSGGYLVRVPKWGRRLPRITRIGTWSPGRAGPLCHADQGHSLIGRLHVDYCQLL